MPYLYQRGRTWWCQFQRNGKQIRYSLKTKDKATALRHVEGIEYEMIKARVMADLGIVEAFPMGNGLPGCPTINEQKTVEAIPLPASPSEAWAKYEAWATIHLRPNTLVRCRQTWTAFTKSNKLGLTPDAVEQFKARLLKKGYAPKSINGYVGDLRAIFNRMIRLDVLPGKNPAAGVSMLHVVKRPPKFLTVEESDRLVEVARAHGPDILQFVALCLYAGLRKGEAIAARWEWVDWKARTITVQPGHGFIPKDKDCRTVPLSEKLIAVLTSRKQASGYLIADGKQPGQRYRWCPRSSFTAVCVEVGVEGCTPHTLRHTFASQLVQAGVSLFKVQCWLGHADAATTQIYAHLTGYDHDVNGKQ